MPGDGQGTAAAVTDTGDGDGGSAGFPGAAIAHRARGVTGSMDSPCRKLASMTLAAAAVTMILPVARPDVARTFYSDVLGLPYRGTAPDGKVLFDVGSGATLALMEKPAGAQADHTAISFEVSDIGASIKDLKSRGAVFADYDLPGLKTTEHVCVLGAEKAAWFEDPDGNILCLHEVITG
jgi:predicted enzyme related to lactoylglutathione lyase